MSPINNNVINNTPKFNSKINSNSNKKNKHDNNNNKYK